jgi:hypothetical protein
MVWLTNPFMTASTTFQTVADHGEDDFGALIQ